VLQPDQLDGDNFFKTPLPRVARADFPPGRGFYIRRGVARRFQAALPEVGG
jgi:S-DNA-T family DNA segregation ATPase FtsK/SpoIIIE